MSKSVLGLLAGLAVAAAAGRMKRGSYNEALSEPVRKALADLPQEQIKDWRTSMAYRGIMSPTDADWRHRFAEAGIGALQFGAERDWKMKGSRAHAQDRDFGTFTSGLTPQKVIRQAVDHHVGEAGTYPMELVGDAQSFVMDANERAGISPFRFQGRYGKLGLKYTADELVKLLKSLKDMDDEMEHDEDEDDSPGMLRSSILTTLGIEEV